MSMNKYTVVTRCRAYQVQLLVTESGDDVLKARLNSAPSHPRALLTLLEGLALWQGAPVYVAVYVDRNAQDLSERVLYGDGCYGLLGPQSPLVVIEHRLANERPHRIRGLGDFRQLRIMGDVQ